MTPSVCDFFKSFYYQNTYIPPIDLSSSHLKKYNALEDVQTAAATAQKLMSHSEVREIFAKTLCYEKDEVVAKNTVLRRHGFRLLSHKPFMKSNNQPELFPYYSVVEHKDLPKWIIKSLAKRCSKSTVLFGPQNERNEVTLYSKYEGFFRIPMADRIRAIAKELNIDVIVPQKYIVPFISNNPSKKFHECYFLLCEKIDVLSVEDTLKAIGDMPQSRQKHLAICLSKLISAAGIVDASLDNIRLTKTGKIAIIDTEPGGLMTHKKNSLWKRFISPYPSSVEKCARIGLYTLFRQTDEHDLFYSEETYFDKLETFRTQLKREYDRIASPKLSKWKITLSVIFPLLPLSYAVASLVKCKLTQRAYKKLEDLDAEFQEIFKKVTRKSQKKYLIAKFSKIKAPLVTSITRYFDGVPFQHTSV